MDIHGYAVRVSSAEGVEPLDATYARRQLIDLIRSVRIPVGSIGADITIDLTASTPMVHADAVLDLAGGGRLEEHARAATARVAIDMVTVRLRRQLQHLPGISEGA